MDTHLLSLLRPAYVPAAILLATALGVALAPPLPASLAGLKLLGPAALLFAATAISVWFNRGRAFILLASLLCAWGAYAIAQALGAESFAARALFTAIVVLVPLNVVFGFVFAERGVFHHFNYRWAMVAAGEALAVAWVASAGRSALSGTAWHTLLEHWLLRSPPVPVLGRLMFAAAFAAAVARAWPRHAPLDIGLASALIAFFAACEWTGTPGAWEAFSAAAGAIVLVSLLQESHRLAFRDELTGLHGRRALEERLPGLGPVYTIAMVDVDHFKAFNDAHGHDIGDQVLKLVAARLARVEGGGTAYRYGGEEFAVLFPGRPLLAALPHVERMRAEIEGYRMAVRSPDRPKDAETGSKQRESHAAGAPPDKILLVTVSIGVAERNAMHATPFQVMRAADKAMYRAKQAGRNRVSQ